jgi:hypothetical protein
MPYTLPVWPLILNRQFSPVGLSFVILLFELYDYFSIDYSREEKIEMVLGDPKGSQ